LSEITIVFEKMQSSIGNSTVENRVLLDDAYQTNI